MIGLESAGARLRRHRADRLILHPDPRSAGQRFAALGAARAARSARSTARARATREATSILWKMWRRWVSTVFLLRNSSAAISGFVLRSTTSRATCSSRSVSDSRPVPSVLPGRVRRWVAMSELAEFALRLVAVAQRAAGVQARWPRAEARRSRGRARRLERVRGPRACATARPRSERGPRSAAAADVSASVGGAGRVAVVQGDRRGGSVGPGGSERQLHGRGRGGSASGRALGLVSPSEREPAARQQFEAVRPPAAGDERQLLTAGRAEEQLDGLSRLPGFEQNAGEPTAAQAATKPSSRSRARSTLSCAVVDGEVQIADGQRDDGAVEEVPDEGLCIARAVAELRWRRRGARWPRRACRARTRPCCRIWYRTRKRSPCPVARASSEGAAGVRIGLGVEVEVELGRSEPGRRVEADARARRRRGCRRELRRRHGEIELVRSLRSSRPRARPSRAPPPSEAHLRARPRRSPRASAQSRIDSVPRAVELVQRELDQQRDGLGRARLR